MIALEVYSQNISNQNKVCLSSSEARIVLKDLYNGAACDSMLFIRSNELKNTKTIILNQKQIIKNKDKQAEAFMEIIQINIQKLKTDLSEKDTEIKRQKRKKVFSYLTTGALFFLVIKTNLK